MAAGRPWYVARSTAMGRRPAALIARRQADSAAGSRRLWPEAPPAVRGPAATRGSDGAGVGAGAEPVAASAPSRRAWNDDGAWAISARAWAANRAAV